ncbi:MAG: hypothetical protein U5N86_05115, partial [Planctomycetota bacterium]|nr:hypothetical protein [Planctomycetota bacterium]
MTTRGRNLYRALLCAAAFTAALASLACGSGGTSPTTQTTPPPATDESWTILVYTALDNELDSFALDRINRLENRPYDSACTIVTRQT